jgi:tetratricopeptide (TPR) repeat protein
MPQSEPRSADDYYRRGCARLKAQDFPGAITDLSTAIALEPTLAEAYYQRARAYEHNEEDQPALADYTEAIVRLPRPGKALVSRAIILTRRQRFEEALADLDAALREPNDRIVTCWAYTERGDVHAAAGRHEQALADYAAALRVDPDWRHAYTRRGHLYTDTDRQEEAIRDYSEMIRLAPDNFWGYAFRAEAHGRRGDYAAALADHRRVTELNPQQAEAWGYLAWIRATCPDPIFRNGPQALADATRACELTSWQEAGHLDTLAAAHAECGNFAEAIHWAERAVELASDAQREESRARLEDYRAGRPYRDRRGE